MKPSRLILFFLSISLVVGCSDGGVSELANYDQTDTTEISVPPSTEVESSDAMLLSAFFASSIMPFRSLRTVSSVKVQQAATVCRWCFPVK